jgi:hypothetical protein
MSLHFYNTAVQELPNVLFSALFIFIHLNILKYIQRSGEHRQLNNYNAM